DAPASSAEHLQRDLAAGPRRAVVARQSNALPQLAQSTTLACLHESLGLHGGCRTNQTACTNLTMAAFADLVRAAQSARAGPSRPKRFTPKPSPCGKPTKSRPRRWFVRQPHESADVSTEPDATNGLPIEADSGHVRCLSEMDGVGAEQPRSAFCCRSQPLPLADKPGHAGPVPPSRRERAARRMRGPHGTVQDGALA